MRTACSPATRSSAEASVRRCSAAATRRCTRRWKHFTAIPATTGSIPGTASRPRCPTRSATIRFSSPSAACDLEFERRVPENAKLSAGKLPPFRRGKQAPGNRRVCFAPFAEHRAAELGKAFEAIEMLHNGKQKRLLRWATGCNAVRRKSALAGINAGEFYKQKGKWTMKTKMEKKVLPVLLSLLLMFGIMPATAFAADFSSGSNSTNTFNWYSKDVSATDLSYEAGDGTIEWKADTKTLTLRNATVTASTVQISFPSNGNGMEINLVLEGDNVFQKSGSATTAIQTGGCKVIVSGDGNLTMENTSSGFTVHPGGELIFSGAGKVKVEGRGTTALDIMSGGKVTVNSGDVEFTTSNGFGKAIRIQSNSALIAEGGSLTARMDKETTSSNTGAICCDDSTGSIAINGGKVIVSSTTVGISLKSATTIKGNAEVDVASKSGYAIGGAAVTITDNADVTAVSASNTAISGAVEISGNATVACGRRYYRYRRNI